MKQPSKQQLKDRITKLENMVAETLFLSGETTTLTAIAHLGVQWDLLKGEDLRSADIDAKIARRQELGLSTVCTADELDATPMETV